MPSLVIYIFRVYKTREEDLIFKFEYNVLSFLMEFKLKIAFESWFCLIKIQPQRKCFSSKFWPLFLTIVILKVSGEKVYSVISLFERKAIWVREILIWKWYNGGWKISVTSFVSFLIYPFIQTCLISSNEEACNKIQC